MLKYIPKKEIEIHSPVYSDMWSVIHNKDYIGRIKVPTYVKREYDNEFSTEDVDRVKYFHDRSIWRVAIINRFDPMAYRICDSHKPKRSGPYIYSKGPNLILTDSSLMTMLEARRWVNKHFDNQ